ncbi:MAG TPA: hypothetical protein DDZ51_09130 [Planctomycetaceae bacterium]|nr:hypothetical protein [Planctomycetaceae bacterium]
MPSNAPIREPSQIRKACVRKLQAVKVSEKFQAILGRILGADWTTPRLVEMVITPDGHLLGRCDGQTSFEAFLGEAADLIRNIHGVATVAELDGDEIGYMVAKVAEIKRQR